MNKRFAFFYFMNDDIEKVVRTVQDHIQYWQGQQLTNYSGGPFADKSGGLITFDAKSLGDAEKIVFQDPFIREDVLAQKWIKEWSV